MGAAEKFTDYEMGILWALGSYTGGRLVVRHKDRYFLDTIAKRIGGKVYLQRRVKDCPDDLQYVWKTRCIDIDELVRAGWNKHVPKTDNCRDFLRAYIEIHSVLDTYKGRNRISGRLRIYGNKMLIDEMNQTIADTCNVGLKTVQRLPNKVSGGLYYQSTSEIRQMLSTIDGEPRYDKFWNQQKSIL